VIVEKKIQRRIRLSEWKKKRKEKEKEKGKGKGKGKKDGTSIVGSSNSIGGSIVFIPRTRT